MHPREAVVRLGGQPWHSGVEHRVGRGAAVDEPVDRQNFVCRPVDLPAVDLVVHRGPCRSAGRGTRGRNASRRRGCRRAARRVEPRPDDRWRRRGPSRPRGPRACRCSRCRSRPRGRERVRHVVAPSSAGASRVRRPAAPPVATTPSCPGKTMETGSGEALLRWMVTVVSLVHDHRRARVLRESRRRGPVAPEGDGAAVGGHDAVGLRDEGEVGHGAGLVSPGDAPSSREPAQPRQAAARMARRIVESLFIASSRALLDHDLGHHSAESPACRCSGS